MIAPLAKFVDWSVLQIGGAMLLQSIWQEFINERDLKLEQVIQFLNGPDFIPAESKPTELEFTSKIHFKLSSPRPCEFAENNIVRAIIKFSINRN